MAFHVDNRTEQNNIFIDSIGLDHHHTYTFAYIYTLSKKVQSVEVLVGSRNGLERDFTIELKCIGGLSTGRLT